MNDLLTVEFDEDNEYLFEWKQTHYQKGTKVFKGEDIEKFKIWLNRNINKYIKSGCKCTLTIKKTRTLCLGNEKNIKINGGYLNEYL